LAKAKQLAAALEEPSSARQTLLALVDSVNVQSDRVEVRVHRSVLVEGCEPAEPFVLEVAARLMKTPKETCLVLEPSANTGSPDIPLIKLVVRAHAARAAVEADPQASATELAAAQGYTLRHFRVLLRVAYLAPAIVEAILAGRHPPSLTREKLVRMSDLPHGWRDQALRLGFLPEGLGLSS